MRTIIDVPEDDIQRLDQYAEESSASRAAIIREAIRMYLEKKGACEAEAAFGILKHDPLPSLEFERTLRKEWDDRG